jgi:hypothetical protein
MTDPAKVGSFEMEKIAAQSKKNTSIVAAIWADEVKPIASRSATAINPPTTAAFAISLYSYRPTASKSASSTSTATDLWGSYLALDFLCAHVLS